MAARLQQCPGAFRVQPLVSVKTASVGDSLFPLVVGARKKRVPAYHVSQCGSLHY